MLCMKTAFFAASFTKKYGRGLDLALNSNGAKMPKNNADGARGGGRALACGCNRLPPASHVPVKYRFLQKTYLKVILVSLSLFANKQQGLTSLAIWPHVLLLYRA